MDVKLAEQNADQPLLLSIPDAAMALGVKPATIRWWIIERRIGSNKMGGRRLVPRSEIDRLIRESYEPAERELKAA